MNPHTLQARGERDRWAVTSQPYEGGRMLVLNRDGWTIQVAFDGSAPAFAQIHKPGQDGFVHLDRRRVAAHVRGDRAAMGAFRVGDRVKVSDRLGTVTDVNVEVNSDPARPGKVRLLVTYGQGDQGDPYTRFAQPHALEEAV